MMKDIHKIICVALAASALFAGCSSNKEKEPLSLIDDNVTTSAPSSGETEPTETHSIVSVDPDVTAPLTDNSEATLPSTIEGVSPSVLLSESLGYIPAGFTAANGKYYYFRNDYNDQGVYVSLLEFDDIGNRKETPLFEQTDPYAYEYPEGDPYVAEDGTIKCLMMECRYNEETGGDDIRHRILTISPEGTIDSYYLDNILTSEEVENGFYLGEGEITSSECLSFDLVDFVRVCDIQGNLLYDIPKVHSCDQESTGSFITNTGTPAVIIYDADSDGTNCIVRTDKTGSNELSDTPIGDFNIRKSFINGSGDYIVYISTDDGILGVNANTSKVEKLLDLSDIGVDDFFITDVEALDDGSFIVVGHDYSSDTPMTTITKLNR